MGVRIAQWVTMHGFALNINPNMKYFEGMIPCGILDHGVTSLKELTDKDISNKKSRKRMHIRAMGFFYSKN